MNLRVCENPVRIFNKNTHRFEHVPCGKCNTCRNVRNNRWTDRLVQESQCFPYTVFFTLTFDEKNVPLLSLDSDGHSLVDVHSGLVVDLNDLPNLGNMSPMKRKTYIHKRKFIPYVSSDIAQKFVKRLRYYFISLLKYTNENKTLRYFIVSEYGPSTYRPHIHGLLFFFSSSFASRFEDFLLKAWSFGRVDSSFVRDSAASYVARYLDSNAALPRIYLHRQIRPFLLCSKQPPIGTIQASTEELSQIFHKSLTKRTLQDYKRNKFKDVPLWRSFKDRLFPKIQSFDTFDHTQRVTLYGTYRYFSADHEDLVDSVVLDGVEPDKFNEFDYFRFWCERIFNIGFYHDCNNEPNRSFLATYLRYLYDLDSSSSRPGSYYALRNFYYICKRVYLQRSIFNVSLDYYVERIENFYKCSNLEILKNFYELQNELMFKYRDRRLLLFLYHDYADYLNSIFVDPKLAGLLTKDINLLSSFGFNTSHLKFEFIDYAYDDGNIIRKEFYSVKLMFDSVANLSTQFNAKIFRQSLKNKKKNDYLHWIENNDYYNKTFGFNFYKEYA